MFANRFAHFDIQKPDVRSWVNYLLSQGAPREESIVGFEEEVIQNWNKALAKAQGLFAGFHEKTNGRFLHALPPEGSKERGRAWPSPRTWEDAVLVSATCVALAGMVPDHEDVMLDFITALVGQGASSEFATWLREANLPNPEDVLKNGWTPDKLRIDRNYAIYTSMTTYVLGIKEEDKRLKAVAQTYAVLETACDSGVKDLIAPHVAQLVSRGYGTNMIHNPDPEKKNVGTVAARLMAKLGKTKIGQVVIDMALGRGT